MKDISLQGERGNQGRPNMSRTQCGGQSGRQITPCGELLNQVESMDNLDDTTLEKLVLNAVSRCGECRDPADLLWIAPIYEKYRKRITPDQRLRSYSSICGRVETGELSALVLASYVLFDDNRQIVSTASLDFAVLFALPNEPMKGVRAVLDWVDMGEAVNPGAALGGLVMTGDRRVVQEVQAQRQAYPAPVISEMVNCHSGFLYAAVVEFYLGWLEEIDSEQDEELYGLAAAGLANQVMGSRQPYVLEVERNLPPGDDEPEKVIDVWEIEWFALDIESRLYALAKSEKGDRIMPVLLAAWGVI